MPRNVICLVVDRLHAGMVGAYGNSWINTPAIDRLACESFLFDQAVVDSPQLERLYHGLWHGAHAALFDQPSELGASLPRVAGEAGLHTALVTDERLVAELPAAANFAERSLLDSAPAQQTVEHVSETALWRLFETAGTRLAELRPPFLLWVHARALAAPWDAPLVLRNRFADEEDPEPPTWTRVPDYRLADDCDPDEVLGVRHAYAGQVAALDECLAAFVGQLDGSPLASDTQFTLLSARGFPLGEHQQIGPGDEALYNECAQLVWLMRFPDAAGKLDRSRALVQGADLPGTLLDWLGLDHRQLAAGHASSLLDIIHARVESLRDRVLALSTHDSALRTPAWHLRQPAAGDPELYAKPGDRWEVNEVAKLLPEIVAGLQAALAEIEPTGRADMLAPLAEPLVGEVD